MTNEYAIGIDLGTTYSVVGVVRNRNVEIIADQQGSRTTPSVVAFKASEIFVGKPALDEMSIHPTNTVYDSKRMIGRQFSDTDISEDKKIFPFRVTRGKQDRCKICIKRENCATKTYSPEETAAHVLHYLKKSAEVFIGSKVSEAVITVPAYFNNAQKEATKNAAEIVGLKVLHILAEPTAAVIKYVKDNKTEANGQKLLVLDLGGGTFDVSVVEINELNINVISVNGDRHLGGCDLDGVVLNFAIGEIMKKYKIDVSKDSRAIARLKVECEKAKRNLSLNQSAKIIVGSLCNSVNVEIVDVEISISRDRFNTLCKPLFERINGPIVEALKDAHFHINDIDKVITVGGSTNVVALYDFIRKLFFIDSKRMIGRQFSDTDISEDKKIFPFRVTRGKQDRCKICIKRENCATKTYSPEETAAHVLHYLKKSAEVFIGSKVSEAVITVPAYFNNAQKEATKNAAEIVGLKVLHILAEPTAAVIKYLRDNKTEANGQKLLVLDLGGGTFDVSVVKIEQLNINVISVNGDRHLGGCDFDGVVLNFAIGEIMKKYKIDVSKDSKAIARLKIKCEKAKRTLSIDQNARIIVGSLRNSVNAEIVDVEISISRAKFNTLCKPLFERINGPIMEALKDAHFDINDIDKVITVGGSTNVVAFKEIRINGPIMEALKDAHFDINDIDKVITVGGSTNVVAFKEIVRKYFPDSKIVRSLNPDEAVAAGAAIYASEMSSNKNQHFEKITLNNVTPLPLGIKISGNRMHRIIDKNTRIPTTAIQKYTTTMDNQTEVEIAIYEGSGTLITENNCLGKFTLNDLSKLPKGQLEINVTFSINENCILEASAVESANGNRKSIRITRENVQFSIDEIDTLRSNFIMDCSLAEQFNKAKSLKNECEDVSRQTQWEIENQTDTYNLQSPHLNNTTNILNEYIAWSSEPHETLDIDEIKSKIRIVRLAIMPILRRPSDINDLFQGNNN
uniref:Heat shock protein 70 n=1 Tax=Rhabditophanes sp. KR3021 TaxID=114890 RepID=A0AC35TUY7_9BILA